MDPARWDGWAPSRRDLQGVRATRGSKVVRDVSLVMSSGEMHVSTPATRLTRAIGRRCTLTLRNEPSDSRTASAWDQSPLVLSGVMHLTITSLSETSRTIGRHALVRMRMPRDGRDILDQTFHYVRQGVQKVNLLK